MKNFIEEYDSCGIVAVIEKDCKPRHDNLRKAIDALVKLNHRSGFIDGEGDGAGILTDIPRNLWAEKLIDNCIDPEIVYTSNFVIAHIFIDRKAASSLFRIKKAIKEKFKEHNIEIILEESNQYNSENLGPNGKLYEPFFWQIAGEFVGNSNIESSLYFLACELEKDLLIHVMSLSNHSVVYKVLGDASILPKYYLDLDNPLFETTSSLGHNRYSTNTLSHFFRVQPFSLLGHNGEINTIERLKDESIMVDIPIIADGSDSQNLNRVIEGFIAKYNFSLFSAIEILFPPIYNEIHNYNLELKDLYTYLRHIWGPFSQGPAAIMSRYGNSLVFNVDPLGLRPLWLLETDETIYFSSEQGIINTDQMVNDPKALGPGEKIGVNIKTDKVEVIGYHRLQKIVYDEIADRFLIHNYHRKLITPQLTDCNLSYFDKRNYSEGLYNSFGWNKEHLTYINKLSATGKDPISSLGYDGPLAIFSKARVNISDFLKETVAVVTNPAIDREREIEHFSTRVIIGGRESLFSHKDNDNSFEIRFPILLEGEVSKNLISKLNTISLEETMAYFSSQSNDYVATISATFNDNQSITERLAQINSEAINFVKKGAKVLLLDDSKLFDDKKELWLDPHLATASIDTALKNVTFNKENLRRNVSIILRSGSIRNLHDIITAIGLGADAISPYLIFDFKKEKEIINLYNGLDKGLEKIISTLGIHELRGYERLFSAIGLKKEITDVLNIISFYGTEKAGYSFKLLEADARKRKEDFKDNNPSKASYHLMPKTVNLLGRVANGNVPYDEYKNKLSEENLKNPISIRHILDFKLANTTINKKDVQINIGQHNLPFVISSMSFGSQNEVAFKAYAEAAYQLNMISLSGEGGEIKDILGKYPSNRGVQIASGRFGVNIELINSTNWIEIKVGQGAKPGEGGHLPGEKVSDKVAAARNSTPGVSLISPSNNHDIYSIEDLAQIIYELKVANNRAKIIVKVPVVPNIGTIAVGIVKAGADIVSLSGYDGGTGAARSHALQYVGLPIEIGIKLVHDSLIEAGLRDEVEIWADGGIKSGEDVVKLVLLGANRIGFGTLAMMAVGCTACRGCHLDTCHVGISTQINTVEQAKNRGLKKFVPRDFNIAVRNIKHIFEEIANETIEITANLGSSSLKSLVGRSDLLIQNGYDDFLDLKPLILSKRNINSKLKTNILKSTFSQVVGNDGDELNNIEDYNFHHSISNTDRVIGSKISGERVRRQSKTNRLNHPAVSLAFKNGSIAGNGLAAYLGNGINIQIEGGSQDGLAKTANGGRVIILKSLSKNGLYINGSVGKGFCYGAQKGLFIIQGNADSRAGIRLSGADVIFGGEITSPIQDHLGCIAANANIKGFAFEYMTNGRVLVLGDPGPWICSGMTGGIVYQRIIPEFGLDLNAIKRRIAKGANVEILNIDEKGKTDISELLFLYIFFLEKSGHTSTANRIRGLLTNLELYFVRIVPILE